MAALLIRLVTDTATEPSPLQRLLESGVDVLKGAVAAPLTDS